MHLKPHGKDIKLVLKLFYVFQEKTLHSLNCSGNIPGRHIPVLNHVADPSNLKTVNAVAKCHLSNCGAFHILTYAAKTGKKFISTGRSPAACGDGEEFASNCGKAQCSGQACRLAGCLHGQGKLVEISLAASLHQRNPDQIKGCQPRVSEPHHRLGSRKWRQPARLRSVHPLGRHRRNRY